jgi:starch phosphorylase
MSETDLFPHLPEPIGGLERLAYNLWWSWHPPAQELFHSSDSCPMGRSGLIRI